MRKFFTLLFISAISFPALAQQKIIIKAANIPGESQLIKDGIDATAFSNGASNTYALNGAGGSGAGKPSTDNFDFTIAMDKSVNVFRQMLYTGMPISKVEVDFETQTPNTGKLIIFSKIEMEQVFICSVSEGGSDGDGRDQINIGFIPIKFRYTYYPLTSAGQPGTPVIFGWDNSTNKAW